MENKFLSEGTRKALKTINKIFESFPDYGVVDLFGLYPPKDVVLSIIALSRLQRVLETHANFFDADVDSDTVAGGGKEMNATLLEELAHYSKMANAAYGWKGVLAFCGRLHFGDNRALVKRTGIRKQDIILANWHSKVNRPVSYRLKGFFAQTS